MTATQVHISAHQRPQPAEHFGEVLGQFVSELKRSLFDHYRPERHYMRGPGPKWRERCEKAAAIASDGGARREMGPVGHDADRVPDCMLRCISLLSARRDCRA